MTELETFADAIRLQINAAAEIGSVQAIDDLYWACHGQPVRTSNFELLRGMALIEEDGLVLPCVAKPVLDLIASNVLHREFVAGFHPRKAAA